MNFGIDNNILSQPFSLLVSLSLFFGSYQFGTFIIKYFNLQKIFLGEKYYKYFSICLFINIILPFLHFFLLIGKGFILFSNIIGIIIFFSFLVFLKNINFKKKNFYFHKGEILVFILVFLFFLSSLGPITNADSLDYHSGVALYALNFDSYPNTKIWFHSVQSGAGESIIALSFYFKSEQFGSLIQFSGILPILGVFSFVLDKYKKNKNILNYIFILIALSCPIFIQLITSIKPQMFQIGSVIFIFALTFFLNDIKNLKEKILVYSVVFLFLGNAFISKYYFLLSSTILIIFFALNNVKKLKEIYIFFLIAGISFFLIIFPTFLWKYNNYDVSLIDFFLNAFPTKYAGYDSLQRSIVSDGTNLVKVNFELLQILFPLKLINFTESLGLGVLLFLLIKLKNSIDKKIIFISILHVILIIIFGQQSARFFIEPYLWLILLAFKNINFTKKNQFLINILSIQPIFIGLTLIGFILFISSGSLSENLRQKVMKRSANGYELAKWVDQHIKEDELAIFSHRSISLPSFRVVSIDYLKYLDFRHKSEFENSSVYFEEVKKFSPKYIIFYGDNYKNEKMFKCVGKIYKSKKDIGSLATRNFFFWNKFDKYDGHIYYFKKDIFPECLREY